MPLGASGRITPRGKTTHQQREAQKRIAVGGTQCIIARSYNVSQATIFAAHNVIDFAS
jgi:hypothetical protein